MNKNKKYSKKTIDIVADFKGEIVTDLFIEAIDTALVIMKSGRVGEARELLEYMVDRDVT